MAVIPGPVEAAVAAAVTSAIPTPTYTIKSDNITISYNVLDTAKVGVEASDYKSSSLDMAVNSSVRRPYRGISIKKESFASISIVSNKTTFANVSLKNSSTKNKVAFTSNFLINSVSENRQEKHQPVPTFGKDYVYFFGEQPRQMTFNATLLNTENFRWEEEWWDNYENHFRGTRLAARSQQVRIRVDESIIYGYMITCSTNKDSNNPHVVTLTFTVHVTDIFSTRPAKIGSHEIQEGAADAYGYVDMNPTDIGKNLPTFVIGKDSQAIRKYNQKAYLSQANTPGSVSRLLNKIPYGNEIADGISAASAEYQEFVDFIYGRNIVLPVDAAYAQFSSGNPSFAEGTEAFDTLQNQLISGSPAIYREKGEEPHSPRITGSYTDNTDEYPYKGVIGTIEVTEENSTTSLTQTLIKEISKAFNVEESYLTAGHDGSLYSDPVEKIREAREKAVNSKGAFAAFQISVATLSSAVRSSNYKKGKYKVFPNEVFSSGLLGLQYTGGN